VAQDCLLSKNLCKNLFLGNHKMLLNYDKLTIEQKNDLANALLACPVMRDRVRRQTLVDNLPLQIRDNFQITGVGLDDAFNILRVSNDYSTGLQELLNVIEALEGGESKPFIELKRCIERLRNNRPIDKSELYRQLQKHFTEDLGNAVALDMIFIPGGRFLMGSPDSEKDRSSCESPQHQVKVSAFWMGKYQVTQAQWRAVAQLPTIERDLNLDPSYYKGEDRPVEQISWLDAVEFCKRLSKKTGKEYRLPSEAEWEYACRAGTTTPFHFGETISPELANSKGKYSGSTPVGSYKVANAFGLYDMHGNVWEWCEDFWHNSYRGAPTDGSAWLATRSRNKNRVMRGGSCFYGNPRYCRSAIRNALALDNRLNDVGLRVVFLLLRT
jgi:formylglycine-generating enzyme required for sulfatase activity